MSCTTSISELYKKRNFEVIKLSNELLEICHLKGSFSNRSKSIKTINQLNSTVFIFLYEKICNAELIDKKLPSDTEEDEIHNLQAIIDTLSLDILHEDLSHITGESIYNSINFKSSDLTSIEYLLDILKSINEWISSQNQEVKLKVEEFRNESLKQDDIQVSPIKNEEEIKRKTPVKQTQIKKINFSLNNLEEQKLKQDLKEQQVLIKEYIKQKENESKLNKFEQKSDTNSHNSLLLMQDYEDGNSNTSIILQRVNNFYKKKNKLETDVPTELKHDMNAIQTIDNELKQMRLGLNTNLDVQQAKIINLLKTIYDDDFKDAKFIAKNSLDKFKNKSIVTNQLYLDTFSSRPETTRSSLTACRSSRSKGVLYDKVRWLKPIKKRSKSCISLRAKNIDSLHSRFTIGENGILASLLEEFPHLCTSPEMIHYLWEKHSKQIETFSQMHKEIEGKYLKNESSRAAQNRLEESYKKQQMLMDIMRKDLQHIERVHDLKRKIELENSMKSKQRDQRLQSAKVKRYYDEFRIQHKARMLEKTTNEELVFKKLFNESLKIQKERLLELKRYAKEKSELNTKEQLNQIQSIENYYKSKFDLLNEQLSKEKEETLIREKAQHFILTRMKNQVKKKLENDIRELQDQMAQEKDSLFWRQKDAERIQTEVYSASYYRPSSRK